ncbi:hypothetical protein [Micromonospora chokoriensis]
MGDGDAAPGRAGDRGRASISLQGAGIGEPGAVVADLGQNAGTGHVGQTGEACHDRVVRVLVERFAGGLVKRIHAGAFDVQRPQQCQRLDAHRFRRDGRLTQLRTAQRLLQLGGQALDAAAAADAA